MAIAHIRYRGFKRFLDSSTPLRNCAITGVAALACTVGLGVKDAAAVDPVDATVVSGSITIDPKDLINDKTTINQTSGKGIIEWSSFDSLAGETVEFVHSNKTDITLNRILDDNQPTNWRGHLEANGNVWVVDPNGFVFHSGSSVDVGGLLLSSANIPNNKFLNGNRSY